MFSIQELLIRKKLIVCPAVFDTLSALLVERAGYDIAYISGLGVAASDLGLPDIGLLTQTEIVQRAADMAQVLNIPIICDADTGYGDAKNVHRTISLLEAAGVQGAQLEDQTLVKRCGYLAGKEVIPTEEYLVKLKTAVAARKNRDFVIVARTDAKEQYGMDEVAKRLNIYADNGADLVMSGSIHTLGEYKWLAKGVKVPLIANTPTDPTVTSLKQWEETGVKVVNYFTLLFCSSIKAQLKALKMLKEMGSVEAMKDEFVTYEEYLDVVKYHRWMDLREKMKK